MSSDLFYKNLPSFTNFQDITEDEHFHEVPNDWFVFITDVKGSTQAIEAGKYKDVNTIGAAAIATVQNTLGDLECPFVFGGDGATLLVPPSAKDKVCDALLSLKTLAQNQFQLQLRVGCVPVSEIKSEGSLILIAKHRLIGSKYVAIFRGGGLALAELKVKGSSQKYELVGAPDQSPELTGLSCRWQPIDSKNGSVLSLLVVARTDNHAQVYKKVLRKLEELFDGKLDSANPVNVPTMNYKSLRQCLADESRYQKSIWSLKFLFRSLEIIAAVLIFKFNLPPVFFNSKAYAESMRTHSDYRKFDDALRMILDCSPQQVKEIRTYFQTLYESGEVYYGIHESKTSLMTCYVNNLNEGGHIHFVDGADGGYAMAAKQLKQQSRKSG